MTEPGGLTRIERLERALALAAFVVLEHGETYAPILARLEREVERERRSDPKSRAARILENIAGKATLPPGCR